MAYYPYRFSNNYKKSYSANAQQSVSVFTEEELTDPAIATRITKLLEVGNTWEKEFLSSVGEYFSRKKFISIGQMNTFKKIEDKYSPQKVLEQNAFASIFTQEMRENMKNVALIYKQQDSPFFTNLVEKTISDDKFIPTKAEWDKFMENDYARGYIENINGTPKFKIGDTVIPKDTKNNPIKMKLVYGLVIEVNTDLPNTHAVGGKKYTILPFGLEQTIVVEERYLKNYKSK